MLIKHLFSLVRKFVFPNSCIACQSLIDDSAILCLQCWQGVEFIGNNICQKCCEPMEFEFSDEILCVKCIKNTPIFTMARSIFSYKNKAKDIVHKFKYEDKTFIAKKMAKIIFNKYEDFIEKSDIIAPVPMHKNKLLKRNYNQSLILSQLISKTSSKIHIGDLLIKNINTKPQFSLKYDQRMKNLKNSFQFNKQHLGYVLNKNILLVDDVMTTGATANSCAEILLKNGCKSVNLITLAKTRNLLN